LCLRFNSLTLVNFLKMKKGLLLAILFLSKFTFSQAPQSIHYQGVARDAGGTIISSGSIGLKFEILQGATQVYSEEQSASPSAAGIFTAAIGTGTNSSGSFSAINWSAGPYFIRVSLDETGGTSFTTVGTSQLRSVPYSLYAEKAGSVNLNAGNGISISSGTITNSAPDLPITITGATGTYPNFTVNTGSAYTGSTGISVTGSVITNTAPDQTITLAGAGSTTVGGTYPNFTIGTPTLGAPVITGTGATSVTTAGNNYTVNTPPVTMSYTPATGILAYTPATVINTINVSPSVSVTGSTLTVGTSSAVLPGVGLWSRPTTTATILGNPADFVGMGTTNPVSELHVESPNAPQLSLISSSGLGSSVNFGSPTINVLGRVSYDIPQAKMSFWTNNTPDRMVIDVNGYVGIGTNAPSERLQVQSGASSDISIVSTPSNFSSLNFGTNTNHFLAQIQYNSNTGNMTMNSNGFSDRLFFEATGRNGMGTALPVSELDVNGSLRLNGSRLFLGAVGGVNSGYTGLYEQSSDLKFAVFDPGAPSNPPFAISGNSKDAMVIKSGSGNVGINTNFPSAKFEVSGNVAIADAMTSNYVTVIRNNISSGIDGGALQVTNSGQRSISNNAMLIENLATKVGGSGTTKTGLMIQSVGSWAPGTGQPNVGLFVNATGADINNSAIFMGGEVGIGTTTPSALLHVNGYTKLGNGAPAVQMIKVSGSTASAAGGSQTIPIPAAVNMSKVLAINVMVNYGAAGDWIQPGFTASAGFEYYWYTSGNNIVIQNQSGNSGSILSKAVQVLITYEQ
jgi:hypothetical protein